MTYTVSVTSQGQISIPAKLRQKLGLEKSRKAFVSEHNGKLIVEPVADLLELGGSVETDKKPLFGKKMHDFFAHALADKYTKKIK